MSTGKCSICGGPINPNTDYRKVVGWERHRNQGGTNALRCREPLDEYACTRCVDRSALGISPNQTAMF